MSGIDYYMQKEMRPKALVIPKNNFQNINCGKLLIERLNTISRTFIAFFLLVIFLCQPGNTKERTV